MNSKLYYPGFEVKDDVWLKFALLYLDNIETIVPHCAQDDLSELHRYLRKNTDLLKTYHPEYCESQKATDDAIELISKIVDKPWMYNDRFGGSNFLEHWRNKKTHKFELYTDKFTDAFMYYCSQNNFASESRNGLRVPHDLGLLYMSLLAFDIAANKGKDVITDSKRMDKLKNLTDKAWSKNKAQEELIAMKSFIELKIPRNIREISISDIIEIRNRPSYREKLKNFHAIVEKTSKISDLNTSNINQLDEELKYNISDITSNAVNLSITAATATFGICIALESGQLDPNLIKELLGIGFIATASVPLYHSLQHAAVKFGARSYLTQLKILGR